MNHWIIKSEPHTYSMDHLTQDKTTAWTGVRNYQARNNLRQMKVGDLCLYYHSGDEKQIVGIAEVIKPAYQDPTTPDPNWVCVDIKAHKKLKSPITLATLKAHPTLSKMLLIRHTRLSVIPISPDDYQAIISLSSL